MRRIILIIFTLLITSCDKDYKKLRITDFNQKKEIKLEPYKFIPYAMLNIKVKGHVNDTIKISYDLYGKSDYYISGSIDTLLVYTDYYGEGPVNFYFDPYKATKGDLIIEFKL